MDANEFRVCELRRGTSICPYEANAKSVKALVATQTPHCSHTTFTNSVYIASKATANASSSRYIHCLACANNTRQKK